ncbi:MAG: hypothetical protein ACRD3C_03785 [Vicinamibacterales bacterium]
MRTLNGKTGEFLRWVLGLAAACVVAYFTTISAMKQEITRVEERENNHFEEVLRRLDVMSVDIRELRNRP